MKSENDDCFFLSPGTSLTENLFLWIELSVKFFLKMSWRGWWSEFAKWDLNFRREIGFSCITILWCINVHLWTNFWHQNKWRYYPSPPQFNGASFCLLFFVSKKSHLKSIWFENVKLIQGVEGGFRKCF